MPWRCQRQRLHLDRPAGIAPAFPIPAKITTPLVDGLRNDVVVTNDLARGLFPLIKAQPYASAIGSAIKDLDEGHIETAWSDATSAPAAPRSGCPLGVPQRMIIERRGRVVAASPQDVYRVVTGIGAAHAWYFANWAWRLTEVLDRQLGGAGLHRGRRHPDDLRIGDALDFWRVEDVQAERLVRLHSEMKMPGRAWLQYEVSQA